MHARVTVTKPERPIHVAIDLPRSKSIANRALILASLVGDLSLVQNMGDADDTRILYGLLRDRPAVMHCGLGGTTFRFLLAWASVQEGEEHIVAGVREYWIVDYRARTVDVLVLDGGEYVQRGQYREGDLAPSEALPGFAIPVADIFAR